MQVLIKRCSLVCSALLMAAATFMFPAIALAGQFSQSVSNSFQVAGNQVLKPGGSPYIPEGISVYGGLEDTDYAENLANIDAQIKAAAAYWHTNTIRLIKTCI